MPYSNLISADLSRRRKVTLAAQKFGPTQGKAAQKWVSESIEAGNLYDDFKCDAIGVCALGCPTGMTAVAPPTRSLAYSVTGPEEGYTPGELVEVHVSVHQRLLRNKLQAGQADGEMVSAKYIGLLLYAVATGDAPTVARAADAPLSAEMRWCVANSASNPTFFK